MDAFRLCLAFGPLALYFLVLGWINLGRRPFVIGGSRDLAALGVALFGLIVIGPVELLLPQHALERFGPYVWLMVTVLYGLCLALAVMLSRQRLVVYNVTLDQLRAVLGQVTDYLDPDARWAGASLSLPRLNVELHLDAHPFWKNVSLVASSDQQSFLGWRSLEVALAARLKPTETGPNYLGLLLVVASVAMLGSMGWVLVFHPHAVTQGFFEMLRL